MSSCVFSMIKSSKSLIEQKRNYSVCERIWIEFLLNCAFILLALFILEAKTLKTNMETNISTTNKKIKENVTNRVCNLHFLSFAAFQAQFEIIKYRPSYKV